MISSCQLRGEIKKQLDIHNWSYKDLGIATGYTEKTVTTYMSSSEKQSMQFERNVRNVLKIQEV